MPKHITELDIKRRADMEKTFSKLMQGRYTKTEIVKRIGKKYYLSARQVRVILDIPALYVKYSGHAGERPEVAEVKGSRK